MMIHIGIIEDQELIVDSLVTLIESEQEFVLWHTAHTVEDFLDHAEREPPNIILLDIGLPGGMSGLEGIQPLKKQYPGVEIIILTTFDDPSRIFKALCAGASAYMTKRTPFARVAEVIRTVSRGGSYMSPAIARQVIEYFSPKKKPEATLTPRQAQIADGLVQGLSYKMIADKLMITDETVRDHVKKMYRKLQINSRGELISMRVRGELD